MTARLPPSRTTSRAFIGAVVLFAAVASAHPPVSRQIELVTEDLDERPTAELLVRRGDLYRAAQALDAAERDYREAARLVPDHPAATLGLAIVSLERGNAAASLSRLNSLSPDRQDHADALEVRARALAASGSEREAADTWGRAIERTELPIPEQYLQQAGLLAGLGALDEAITVLDAGLARLGPAVSLLTYAIDLEVERGSEDAALSRLEAMTPYFERTETLSKRRGDILLAAGRTMEAMAAYTEALMEIEELPPHLRDTRATRELELEIRSVLSTSTLPEVAR